MASTKKRSVLGPVLALAGATLLCGGFLWLRLRHLHAAELPVNWLAELWAPCSLLSIIIVIFVEKLSSPVGALAPGKGKKKKKR